jgi:multimeric flavodoxin WrbA
MSGSSSPAGVTQTTVNRDPWAGQQPFLERGFQEAERQLETPQEFFPGSTVVPFAPQTEAALQGSEALAAGGSPEIDAARGQNLATIQGGYLSAGNPYFGNMMDRIERQVRPRVDSMFARAGRSGGSAGHAEAMSRALADAGSALAFQNYGNERGRQMQAMQQAPGMYMSAFAPAEQMRQVGQAREGQAGAQLQEQIARHQFGQTNARDQLRDYMALIGGGQYGGSTTQAQPYFSQSPFATGLGVASTLASIYGNLNRG